MPTVDPERLHAEQDDAIALLSELIRKPSVTPDDAGCQDFIATRLEQLGFACEPMPFGEVSNLWARMGTAAPLLCFAGHTDVVPPGAESDWATDPFDPVLVDGHIHGRGAADMKGGLVAMLLAVDRFLAEQPDHMGSIAFLITSDEEGPAVDGTKKVLETLAARDEKIDYCIVGEPSSRARLGDVIRIGRRGSLSGKLEIRGVQGHVAYPEHADNPIHRFAPVLNTLHDMTWDEGNENFPPTSMQIVEVQAGVGAPNVTPPSLSAEFNFRYSNEWDHNSLRKKVEDLLQTYQLEYGLDWILYGEPYLTQPGTLIDAVVAAVTEETGIAPELSTGGGTSDGRFISPTGAEVVELGQVNATVHKANERVAVEDVCKLADIYTRIMASLLRQ
jgi:succinyl-diaminopimelate desuccinylase